jgi:protein-arginine kinase activator protein McsA
MTEEQMEKLAEIIFQKLLTKQAEFDKQFIEQINQTSNDIHLEIKSPYTEYTFGKSEKEELEDERSRLNNLLSRYEETEEYEKAAIIKNKLTKIINKLKNYE